MNRFFRVLLSLIVFSTLIATVGCGRKDKSESLEIVRMDEAIADWSKMDSASHHAVLDSMEGGIRALFAIYGIEELSDSMILAYSNSPAVTMFMPDVRAKLPGLSSQERLLGKASSILPDEFPGVDMPKLYAMVSPFNQSVIRVDSVILVGLNHYLGSDYPGYKGRFEEYQCALKVPDRIAQDIIETVVVTESPYESATGHSTVLSRMVYEGAVIEAMHRLMPDVEVSALMGYSPEQWKWLEQNERPGWDALVKRSVLYSTDVMDAAKLVAPAPATTFLNTEAPGRMGRYYGYKIVESFLRKNGNSDIKAADLLKPEFYNADDILLRSGYNG